MGPSTVGKTRVAVIGGGIAGISAAEALRERGFEVVIIEERMHLGGKLGAHPGRVPLDRLLSRGERELDETRGKGVGTHRDVRALIDDFDKEGVPEYFRDILAQHLRRKRKLLGLDEPAPSSQLEVKKFYNVTEQRKYDETKPGDSDPDGRRWGAKATVEVAGRCHEIDVEFVIRERFDGRMVYEITDGAWHEHCYHMYLNWYRNFWNLMERVGISRSREFISFREVVHLYPGREPVPRRARRLRSPASVKEGARNLLSGAGTTADLTLWLYSMADLVSHRFDPANYLDRQSVHAFLSSRWYATEGSAKFHEHLLAKAFAVPTYFSSAYTYRKYVEYSLACPDPMLWVLRTNSHDGLFKPLAAHLSRSSQNGSGDAVHIFKGQRVTSLWRGKGKKPRSQMRVGWRPADMRGFPRNSFTGARDMGDDGERSGPGSGYNPESFCPFQPDYIVLALPPQALTELAMVDYDENSGLELNRCRLMDELSSLASIRKLKSGVTAVLDLYFFTTLQGIPSEHCVLLDSDLGLTFVDNSQLWNPGSDKATTHLSVAVTDFYKIDGLHKDDAIALVIEDLERFIRFDRDDIDFSRTYLQKNDLEPLFVNEVGSEPWRPGAVTDDPRIFLAGDFCDNPIGVVSVEAAVVSGLLAARAIQAALRRDQHDLQADDKRLEPIEVLLPEKMPLANVEAYKALFFNDAVAAHVRSLQAKLQQHPEVAVSPADTQREARKLAGVPSAVAQTGLGLATELARWVGESHSRTARSRTAR